MLCRCLLGYLLAWHSMWSVPNKGQGCRPHHQPPSAMLSVHFCCWQSLFLSVPLFPGRYWHFIAVCTPLEAPDLCPIALTLCVHRFFFFFFDYWHRYIFFCIWIDIEKLMKVLSKLFVGCSLILLYKKC